jgi:hypothetical protein
MTDLRSKLRGKVERKAAILEAAKEDEKTWSDYDSRLALWVAEKRYNDACRELANHIAELEENGIIRFFK